MKRICSFAPILMLVFSCQSPTPPAAEDATVAVERYTTTAPEIDASKAGMTAYLEGNWDAFRSGYTEDAEIFHNSTSAMTIDETIASLQDGLTSVSSYGWDDEQYWERIITDEGEVWVYFWGVWEAQHASSDTQFEVPVHIAWLYVDGKVTEEFGFWDSSQSLLAEMEAAQPAQ
jgi:hypothetical protein